ncbi:MAG: helix-turn-helix domain-containing protein [Culicoidibacterales bacterium]
MMNQEIIIKIQLLQMIYSFESHYTAKNLADIFDINVKTLNKYIFEINQITENRELIQFYNKRAFIDTNVKESIAYILSKLWRSADFYKILLIIISRNEITGVKLSELTFISITRIRVIMEQLRKLLKIYDLELKKYPYSIIGDELKIRLFLYNILNLITAGEGQKDLIKNFLPELRELEKQLENSTIANYPQKWSILQMLGICVQRNRAGNYLSAETLFFDESGSIKSALKPFLGELITQNDIELSYEAVFKIHSIQNRVYQESAAKMKKLMDSFRQELKNHRYAVDEARMPFVFVDLIQEQFFWTIFKKKAINNVEIPMNEASKRLNDVVRTVFNENNIQIEALNLFLFSRRLSAATTPEEKIKIAIILSTGKLFVLDPVKALKLRFSGKIEVEIHERYDTIDEKFVDLLVCDIIPIERLKNIDICFVQRILTKGNIDFVEKKIIKILNRVYVP